MLDMLEVCRCGWRIFLQIWFLFSSPIMTDFSSIKFRVFLIKKKKKKVQNLTMNYFLKKKVKSKNIKTSLEFWDINTSP